MGNTHLGFLAEFKKRQRVILPQVNKKKTYIHEGKKNLLKTQVYCIFLS